MDQANAMILGIDQTTETALIGMIKNGPDRTVRMSADEMAAREVGDLVVFDARRKRLEEDHGEIFPELEDDE